MNADQRRGLYITVASLTAFLLTLTLSWWFTWR
jgi:hypothetical protein